MKERVRTTGDKDSLAGELQEEGVGRTRLPDEQTEEVAPLASNLTVEVVHEEDEDAQVDALLILLRRGKNR